MSTDGNTQIENMRKEQRIREIAHTIFYLPAANGASENSMNHAVYLINQLIIEYAWEHGAKAGERINTLRQQTKLQEDIIRNLRMERAELQQQLADQRREIAALRNIATSNLGPATDRADVSFFEGPPPGTEYVPGSKGNVIRPILTEEEKQAAINKKIETMEPNITKDFNQEPPQTVAHEFTPQAINEGKLNSFGHAWNCTCDLCLPF